MQIKSKKHIYFRADGGKGIGYGHFVRTLAVANLVKDKFDCYYVTQKPNEWQKQEIRKVCNLIELPSDDSKFDRFLDMLSPDDMVFLDNYFNVLEYQLKIKNIGCKVVCMGDPYNDFCCDAVIGYVNNKKLFKTLENTKLYLGFDWVILRQPFLEINNCPKENMVTVCYGGIDEFHLTEQTVKIIKKISDIRVNVISNFDGDRKERLQEQGAMVYSNIEADKIADLYSKSQFVLTSSSISALEALAVKSKLIMGYYIDNQKYLYSDIIDKKLAIGIGDLNSNLNNKLEIAIHQISSFIPEYFDFSKSQVNYINLFDNV